MQGRALLATVLLGVGLCFMPALGYGGVEERLFSGYYVSWGYFELLKAEVSYMMHNPSIFINVVFYYDQLGGYGKGKDIPEGLDTKGKIYVRVGTAEGYGPVCLERPYETNSSYTWRLYAPT